MDNNNEKNYMWLFYFGMFVLVLVFLVGFIRTYALVNNESTYTLTMTDYDSWLENIDCGNNGTEKDVVNSIIDSFDDTYFDLIVGAPAQSSQVQFYLNYKDNTSYYWFWVYGSTNKINLTSRFNSTDNKRAAHFTISSANCSNYQNSSGYQNFVSYYTSGGSTGTSGNGFDTNNFGIPNYSWDNIQTISDSNINNSDSYNFSMWYYYSSHPFTYNARSSFQSNNSLFLKKLCIIDNDTCYVLGDNQNLPSYYDLYHNRQPEYNFLGYSESLKTFYTNLSPSDLSNYSLNITFNVPQSLLGYYQQPQDYINNTNFNYVCSGRIDNVDYYSYESFNCSLSSSYTLTDSSVSYTFNNVFTTQNLSNYDKIYITIQSNYLDSNVSTTIFNLGYSYSYGSFFNTDYKGSIYENFTNLPLGFKSYFSSNNSLTDSLLYVKTYDFINYGIKYIGFSNTTNQQNLLIGQSILGTSINESNDHFISTNVSNNIDTGIMIYQENSGIVLPSLDLFFNGGLILSFNNSSSNDFYYIDNNGDIQNGTFNKPIGLDTTRYDISYYIGVVNGFISDLNNDCVQFGNMVQNFYNNMPIFVQSFIFVVFILFCTYFIYQLIRKE